MSKKQEPKKVLDSVKILKNLRQAEMPVDVLLFKERMAIGKLARLSPGSVILFNKTDTEPASLRVHGQAFATGKVVQVGENYGIEVAAIESDTHD